MKLLLPIFHLILFLYDLPLRIFCSKFGRNSYIGFGYKLLFSNKKGVEIGNNVSIGTGAAIQTESSKFYLNPIVEIGDNTMIGKDFFCSATSHIKIGKNCLLSWRVTILDHDHVFDGRDMPVITKGVSKGKPIDIGNNTFIGIGVVILKGVKIGKNSVIGANSVVTKSFDDYSVIAGVPAKLVKKL